MLPYIKITKDFYWVDDENSKYYNKLVKIVNSRNVYYNKYYIEIPYTRIDWKSSEHLIEYPNEYSYAIEIRYNIDNIKGVGSAIFLHCSNNKATAGCIAIPEEDMKNILISIKNETKIYITNKNYL